MSFRSKTRFYLSSTYCLRREICLGFSGLGVLLHRCSRSPFAIFPIQPGRSVRTCATSSQAVETQHLVSSVWPSGPLARQRFHRCRSRAAMRPAFGGESGGAMPSCCYVVNLLRGYGPPCHLVLHRGPGRSYCAGLGEDVLDGRDMASWHQRLQEGRQNQVAFTSQHLRDFKSVIDTYSQGRQWARLRHVDVDVTGRDLVFGPCGGSEGHVDVANVMRREVGRMSFGQDITCTGQSRDSICVAV